MNGKSVIDRDRINRILYGELRGSHEDLIENPAHRFAYAFLRLTEIVVGRVIPIDEARLDSTDDRLEYLKSVENVYASRFNLEYRWYKKEIGPFIGFLGEERTPVLLQYRGGCYRMLSLEDNTERKVDAKLATNLAGEGVMIIPRAEKNIRTGWGLLLHAAAGLKREYAVFLLLTLLATVFSSIVPWIAGYMTSVMIPNGEQTGIFVITISLILGVFAGLLINIMVNRTKVRIQTGVEHQMITALTGRIMDMNAAEEEKISGRIIALIMPFITAAETIVGSFMGGIVFLLQSVMVLGITANADHENIRPLFLLVMGELLFVMVMQTAVYRKTGKERESDARLSSIRREILDNMEAIKTGAIEDRIYYRFAVGYDEKMRVQHEIDFINQSISIVGTLVSGLGILLLFTHFSELRLEDPGKVSALVTSFTLMVSYLNGTATSFAEVAGALPHLKFADMILQATPEQSETGAAEHVLSGRIELQNVSFRYSEDSNPVLRDISLVIHPGEYVGIVGSSGCGKSSLMRLMLGFLTPTEGHISYDNIDIGQFDMKSLRRQFGVVLQDAAVITGSIRQNIALTEDADMEQVKKAAKAAAVDEDIEAMPMKYNTLLSGEAEVISGGQRQRIVLARALMNKPRILFLDEATSAVDNVSQRIIKENLDRLGITRIAIAHRLSTVVNCDRILVMDQGRIVEEGSYSELMAKNGLFAKMARRNIL